MTHQADLANALVEYGRHLSKTSTYTHLEEYHRHDDLYLPEVIFGAASKGASQGRPARKFPEVLSDFARATSDRRITTHTGYPDQKTTQDKIHATAKYAQ